jgi:hypothetical protein
MRQNRGVVQQTKLLSGVSRSRCNTTRCTQYPHRGKGSLSKLHQHRERPSQEILSQWKTVSYSKIVSLIMPAWNTPRSRNLFPPGSNYREFVILISPEKVRRGSAPRFHLTISSFNSRYCLFCRHITLPGEYTVAGAQALYERDNQLEKIRIPGPIREPIVVYVSHFENLPLSS